MAPPIIITSVILAVYVFVLYRITGKNRDAEKLIWAFSFVTVAGFVYHMFLFCAVTRDGFMQFESGMARFLFSVQYSLEMFIANTIIFKGEVMSAMKQEPQLFYFYLPIYGMALLTSGFAIFHFLSRRLHNWMWFTFHKRYAGGRNTHIFVGINDPSCCLAKTIADSKPEDLILFIDISDQQDNPQGISVWDIIARFFKDSKEGKKLNDHVVLKAGKGLKKIVPWLQRAGNNLYILSNSQKTNLDILEELWKNKDLFNCKVYCHAKKEGLVNRYDSITDVKDRIRFVDSSYLAVEYLKKNDTLLPVKFVDIAKEEGKGNLGYVTSSFNCAVIGFGETGKEVLKFLYEFGAFPDINNAKTPFKCHVFEKNVDKEIGEFGIDIRSLHSPEVLESEFVLHQHEVSSIGFRSEMMKLVNELNYVVVCLGDDDTNLNIALNIVEMAVLNGRDISRNFCVAVKQTQLSTLNKETLYNANKSYAGCLHPFGMLDTIWKTEIINNEKMGKDARRFFESYTVLSADINKKYQVDTWEQREEKSRSEEYGIGVRCDAKRKIAQDYSNCLHVTTKRILCESSGVGPNMILPVNVNKEGKEDKDGNVHCTEKVEILEHLAVCEHLRWEASHLMLGYRPTSGRKDNDRKLHNCIVPYAQLDESFKHYDWLVVKNSIAIPEQEDSVEIKKDYVPKPIDTDDVVLPKKLDVLIEQISENVHEVWAESRMSQGWTYGKERNDALKQHPCLVPYKDLPEVEKAYDRNTALGTLKLIMKLGFKITKNRLV